MTALLNDTFSPWFFWLFCGVALACAAGVPRSVIALDRIITRRPVAALPDLSAGWPRAVTWAGVALLAAALAALMLLCRLLAS